MDVMLDIETLSTRPNSVIVTLGAVKFSPYDSDVDTKQGFYVRVNVDEQLALGRHILDSTVEWWGTQPEDVREEALGDGDRISLEDFVKGLNRFVMGADAIWCQGPSFDTVIIENLYRQLDAPVPWNYWQIRDSRTLFQVHGDPRAKERKGAHNALIDCYYQARGVQDIFKQCEIKKREY